MALVCGRADLAAVVWVPDANLLSIGGDAAPAAEMPDLQLTSLEEFVPEEWGLPPYDF